jgi:hypothetical protein
MKRSAPHRRSPGTWILAAGRRIFDEPTMASIIEPAVADLQLELSHAGASRVRQLAARWRGYSALAVLFAVVPFVASSATSGRATLVLAGRMGVAVTILLTAALVAASSPFTRWFVSGTMAGAVLLACAMRWWHTRHPSVIADAKIPGDARPPEINLASIRVSGNVGGLIFTVGSVVIVLVGFPELSWMFLGAVVTGFAVAGGIVAWRRAHPPLMRPENSIAVR